MISAAYYTDTGGRPVNEDSVRTVVSNEGIALAIVCDGLGGQGGGDVASKTAADIFVSGWDGTCNQEKLRALAEKANMEIISRQSPECMMMTTLALVAVSGNNATVMHTGDSRVYWFKNGKLSAQTTDQSVPQISVLLGEITPDQIRFHPKRNQIVHALGEESGPNVISTDITLGPGDNAFLLCSDGFWEYVPEDQMENSLQRSTSPNQWIDMMRRLLEANPSREADCDNNTAAALWIKF